MTRKVWRNVPVTELLTEILKDFEKEFQEQVTSMVSPPVPQTPITPLEAPHSLDRMFQSDHRHFLYLIGPPGVGKTTVLDRAMEMADLTLEMPPGRYTHRLICKREMFPRRPGVYLGKRREQMSGTDALAMNAITGVIDQIAKEMPPLVLGEGDRLANDRMFSTMRNLGYAVTIFYLVAAEPSLTKRLRARGSNQDGAWRKGRATKAKNLAASWRAHRLNGTMPVDHNAMVVEGAITRALRAQMEA